MVHAHLKHIPNHKQIQTTNRWGPWFLYGLFAAILYWEEVRPFVRLYVGKVVCTYHLDRPPIQHRPHTNTHTNKPQLWNLPQNADLSAWLLILITAGAVVFSLTFEKRLWCASLCPIGGMNGACVIQCMRH